MMRIIESNLSFKSLSALGQVKKLTLHNADASSCTIQDVHRWHLNNGWSGCGYHFFVRKDGTIYRGRPEDKLGAHALDNNSNNLGICFEGKYMVENMPQVQLNAGIELVNYLCGKYGLSKSQVYKHKDLCNTDCPGVNFPFSDIVNGQEVDAALPVQEVDTVFESAKKYNSPNCKAIQLLLIANEYNLPKFGADDEYGYETHNQIGAFQLANGLTVDYKVGPNTIRKLAVLIKIGSEGELVRWLQSKVGATLDGDFGNNTRTKVIEYQKNNNLVQDGVVGANTLIKLFGM